MVQGTHRKNQEVVGGKLKSGQNLEILTRNILNGYKKEFSSDSWFLGVFTMRGRGGIYRENSGLNPRRIRNSPLRRV